jgi:hypothetical protein
MVEKYALEIEIFTLSRGFRAQISRSGAQKTHFQLSVRGQSGRTDFFNSIGRSLPIMVTKCAWQIRCNRWSARMQLTVQVECIRVVKWSAISQTGSQVGCLENCLKAFRVVSGHSWGEPPEHD